MATASLPTTQFSEQMSSPICTPIMFRGRVHERRPLTNAFEITLSASGTTPVFACVSISCRPACHALCALPHQCRSRRCHSACAFITIRPRTTWAKARACRDLAHWTHDKTLFGTNKDRIAQPFLGEERLLDYVASLTGYIQMLRTGFPDTRFLAVHTMPQRNSRRGACQSATRFLVPVTAS